MPEPADDFGQGIIDNLPSDSSMLSSTNDADDSGDSGEDPFVSEFTRMFNVETDDQAPVTRETIAEYIERATKEAEQAEELRQKIASYEQQIREAALSQTQQSPATQTQQQAAASEAKRRFQAAQVDAHLVPFIQGNFVEQDANGYYQPRQEYVLNQQVRQACEAKNRQLQSQSAILNELMNDAYSFGDEIVSHSSVVQQLNKRFEEFQKQVEERLKPIQQHTQENVFTNFVSSHLAELTKPSKNGGPPEWSPAGQLFQNLVNEGMDIEKAYTLVQPAIQASMPTVTKKPAKKVSAATRITRNYGAVRPPEVNAHKPLNGRMPFRMTMEQLRAENAASGDDE